MKKLFSILMLSPLMLLAQDPGPVYTPDTLFTTCGYKIYSGRTLQFAKGTGKKDKFRFIHIKNGIAESSLTGNTVLVKEISGFKRTAPGDGSIDVTGTITFKDSSKGTIEIEMMFDRAIENVLELPGELVVPDEFRNNSKVRLVHELNKLLKLYAVGAINKTDYESQKKKLLQTQ